MAVQQVEYLIKANDQMTPVMARVADAMQGQTKQVDTMTKQTKASAAAFNTLGNAMGGLPFAPVLGQFGQLTSQIGSLNKNMGGSATQILAMRAGMVALAAVGGFQLGKAIGDLIFQTEKYNREIDNQIERSSKLNAKLQELASERRQEELSNISLIRDPEAKAEAERKYVDSLKQELTGVSQNLARSRADLERYQNQWTIWRGERAANMKIAEAEIQQREQQQEQLEREVRQLERRNRIAAEQGPIIAENNRRQKLEETAQAMQQQIIELRIGSEEYRKQQELANARYAREEEWIIRLQKQRAEAQEARRQKEEAERDRVKTEQADASFIQNLQAQVILLKEGQDAADEYRAKLSGVSDEAIEQGRILRQELAKLREEQEKQVESISKPMQAGVQAKETRLLTGRSGVRDDPVFKVQQNTFALLKEFREEKRTQRNQLEELRLIRRGRSLRQFLGS
jgi:hypothetical protein